MEELVKFLPEKDIKFANKFIKERNFEAFSELVKSDIYKLESKIDKIEDDYSEERLSLQKTLAQLEKLKSEIDSYLILLGYSENELYGEDDYV
jgi:Arc/MetJ-type ribon-helix-helix transcriptional regulator